MKFRCKQTGNTIEVPETEVENMRQMPHYEEVVEKEQPKKKKEDK
jgi:hypothetical protein